MDGLKFDWFGFSSFATIDRNIFSFFGRKQLSQNGD